MSDTDEDGTAEPRREAEDDHDLLTYGEARVRLFHEVKAQRAVVAELASAPSAPGSAQRLESAIARLAALQDAVERNRRQPINDENFERFFGYKGTPRRNT